jgi:hypothetical protein
MTADRADSDAPMTPVSTSDPALAFDEREVTAFLTRFQLTPDTSWARLESYLSLPYPNPFWAILGRGEERIAVPNLPRAFLPATWTPHRWVGWGLTFRGDGELPPGPRFDLALTNADTGRSERLQILLLHQRVELPDSPMYAERVAKTPSESAQDRSVCPLPHRPRPGEQQAADAALLWLQTWEPPSLTPAQAAERARLWDAAHRSGLLPEKLTAGELNYKLLLKRTKPPYPSITKILHRANFKNLAEFRVWYEAHPDDPGI